jgi:CRISPR system Cascade subunit CasB
MEQSTYLSFESNTDAREALYSWWVGLDETRGDRAMLRRCHDSTEVVFNPAYHKLLRSFNQIGFKRVNKESLAIVVGVLSHVKVHSGSESIATQLASPKTGSDKARVSGLRFRRLLKIKDEDKDELFGSMIGIVRLLDGNLNIYSLANSLYWWNNNTKKQWAYNYYQRAPEEK